MDSQKVKNRVIFTLLLVILIMVTGVVVLARDYFTISEGNETEESQKNFRIEFTSIAEGEKTGLAYSDPDRLPEYTATTATFYANFIAPGDSITYDVQLSNLGNVYAYLQDVEFKVDGKVVDPETENSMISYEISEISRNQVLKTREVRNIKIKIIYDTTASEIEKFDSVISIALDFVQA